MDALEAIIANEEDMSFAEIIGCLELAKAGIIEDLQTVDLGDEDGEDA